MSDHDLPAIGGAAAAPQRPLLLATHSGSFHLDDAFAFATLRLALGLRAPGRDHTLLRSRDAAAIAGADLVWDVGAVYDPATGRFDHHQRGAPVRGDGTPLSAAGLVWRRYGEAAVRAALLADAAAAAGRGGGGPAAPPSAPRGAADDAAPPGPDAVAGAIAAAIDREVVRRIDEIDNGVGQPGGALDLSAMVDDCNPSWDSPATGDPAAAEDAAFLRAADLVQGFLRRRVEAVRARLAAAAEVAAAAARAAAAADPRILELDRKMPWQEPVLAQGLPVLFAVYPVPNGNWMVDAMPTEPGGFVQRLPLPEAWAGLRDAALAEATGVADAVFVHLRRFVGAARSRAGAMAMARQAAALGGRRR